MRVHYLQHVPFENLGSIEAYANEQDWQLSVSHLYLGDTLPSPDSFDGLIVMGGPMGIYDDSEFPWLKTEKAFIRQSIEQNKWVLGICLGAQLIADCLGARVTGGMSREIGWHTVTKSIESKESELAKLLPDSFMAFHWHQDTFEVPTGAVHLCSSEACKNQGFIYQDRVIALQFHLETTVNSATALMEHCHEEMDNSQYVQAEPEILSSEKRFSAINQLMRQLLSALTDKS